VNTREFKNAPDQLELASTPIASWRHFAGFLAITTVVLALGLLAQHRPAPTGQAGDSPAQLGAHSEAVGVYLAAICLDWALLYYCWAGVRRRGGTMVTMSGGRWLSWRAVGADLLVVLPFWVVWEGVAYGVHQLLGPSAAKTVDALLPQSLLEVVLWILTCVTAGICEELVFRGYVQRQFRALTGSLAVAVVAQALVFGLGHAYQGWKNTIVICVLGILYGLLAAWRRNLRANVVAHAWSDIWEGWLKFLVWR
jgi:uncharacterized protein